MLCMLVTVVIVRVLGVRFVRVGVMRVVLMIVRLVSVRFVRPVRSLLSDL
jgi:hypothetical protein